MRGTGVEMQMLSREARRSGRPGMGQVPEKTLPDGGLGSDGGSRPAGPSAVAMARPYSPARSTENPLSQAQERLVSLPRRGRGRQLGVGFSKLFFSSFIPLLPSCQLPQEGPVLPLHLVVPAKKKKKPLVHPRARAGPWFPWLPREEITEAGSERARDMPEVTHPERPRAGSRLQPLGA